MVKKVNFIEKRKTITVSQLLVSVVILIVLVVSGLLINNYTNNKSVNKQVDNAVVEIMPEIMKVEKDNKPNTTMLKVVRDWNNDNKDTNIKVSAEKINDCYIVEAVYKEKNKALNKDGDCDNLREVRGVNTSDKVETILGDSVIHNGDTVVVSAGGFVGSDKVVVELVAPNGEKIVSESILKDGSVSAEFLIPESRKYIGVWSYSIKSDENTFNIENNFIVE